MPGRHMDEMMRRRPTTDVGATPAPIPGAREVNVEAGDLWFEPDVIEIDAGEPVNVTVTSVGDVFHDFVVPELGIAFDLEPGTAVTVGLLVDEPGTYTFVCSVPGHETGGLRGTLIVR
jgi:heme/copper-type cytochrome/quinol oxidase subunit 2